MKKIISLLLILGCFQFPAGAQAQWELDMVRNINPVNPDNAFLKGLTSSAEPIAVAVPAGMLVVSLINHDKKLRHQGFEVMGSLIVATATTQIIKRLVNRPRPYETYAEIYPDVYESGRSFPSGHTTTAFSTAASLTLATKKWYIAVPAFVWATGVGYSRIYLGQHYPSDVMMGALVGTASGFAAHWLMKKISPVQKTTLKQIP